MKATVLPAKYEAGFLTGMDGRLSIAKALKERLLTLTDDLGGATNLSYGQHSLCERVIYLEARVQSWEASLAQGDEVNISQYIYCLNSLLGIFKTLGLQRRAKDGGSLHELLKGGGDD